MADVGREQRWRTSVTLSASSPKTGLICAVLLTKQTRVGSLSRSSRGLGHRPFTAATGVRIPYGMPTSNPSIDSKTSPRPSPAGGCFFVSVQIQSRFYYWDQRRRPSSEDVWEGQMKMTGRADAFMAFSGGSILGTSMSKTLQLYSLF